MALCLARERRSHAVVPPSTNINSTDKNSPDQTDDHTSTHTRPAASGVELVPMDKLATVDHVGAGEDTGPGAKGAIDLAQDLAAAFGDRFELGKHLGKGGFGAVY